MKLGPVSWASVAGEQMRTFIAGDDVIETAEKQQNSLSPPRVAVERRIDCDDGFERHGSAATRRVCRMQLAPDELQDPQE